MNLPLLKAAPALPVRKETVPVPELGGSVVVRGLLASEVFAVVAMRQQALRRLRQTPEPGEPPPSADLDYSEFAAYGKHVSYLLAAAVLGDGGLELYSVDEWESFFQHHPAAYRRLQLVAERLSGLDEAEVEKN